jgi:dienelactone hydrolase
LSRCASTSGRRVNLNMRNNMMKRFTRSAGFLLTVLWFGLTSAQGQVQENVAQFQSGETPVTIECFTPAANGRFPAVFLLHGSGGLEQATGDVFREIARGLASQGYVALIPHYFDRTRHVVGQPFGSDDLSSYLQTIDDGIAFAVKSESVDPDRIGFIGYSMGAYLAFSQSARDPRIKAIVSCSGSLPVNSKAKFPPVLVLQGSKDKGSPAERLKAFQEQMKTNETPCAVHIYRGLGHNFEVSTWEDASRRTAVFFDRYLKRRPPAKPKTKAKRSIAKTAT